MDKEKQSNLVEQISFRHSERICVRTECNESGLREYRVVRAVRLENEAIRAWSKFKTLVSESKNNHRKVAFTLAEVLITLGIIGVVAAITLPAFMENVNSRVKAKRMENIHQKLSKVTDKMASLDVLQGHTSTKEFITEMKKHMNIAKICENNNLAGCWPTSEVTIRKYGSVVGKSNTYAISNATTGESLKAKNDDTRDWDDTMGIVMGDGTSMIISYNKKCSFDANTQGLRFDHASGTSTTLTSGCLAIVYDWNGGSRPNKLGDDVQVLGGATGLGNSCAYETTTGLCIAGAAHAPAKPLTAAECNAQKSTLGITNCRTDNNDYWGAAVAECGGKSKMFTMAELGQIAAEVYGVNSIGAKEDKSGLTFNSEKAAALGLPNTAGNFYVWSGEEDNSYYAYGRGFYSSNTVWGYIYRDGSNRLVLCKGE